MKSRRNGSQLCSVDAIHPFIYPSIHPSTEASTLLLLNYILGADQNHSGSRALTSHSLDNSGRLFTAGDLSDEVVYGAVKLPLVPLDNGNNHESNRQTLNRQMFQFPIDLLLCYNLVI